MSADQPEFQRETQPETQSRTSGDSRVDAALARLAAVSELPVAEHVGIYDEVDHRLRDALTDQPADGAAPGEDG